MIIIDGNYLSFLLAGQPVLRICGNQSQKAWLTEIYGLSEKSFLVYNVNSLPLINLSLGFLI